MKKILCGFLIGLVLPVSHASEGSLKSVGIQAADSSGCYLSDGKKVLGPTIALMVEAYDNHPKLPNSVIVQVIEVAIKSGCDVEEPNNTGLSPLNASILYNSPELAKLLINHGADPKKAIVSKRTAINGLNSRQFLEYLLTRDKEKNRDAMKAILSPI